VLRRGCFPSNSGFRHDLEKSMQKLLIIAGVVILTVGVLWPWLGRIRFGRLPGDFAFEVGGAKVHIPLVTCIVLSVVLTLVLRLFGR
jgi:hypothetical protein